MPRIEAYAIEPKSLTIRERLVPGERNPDPNINHFCWPYDWWRFNADNPKGLAFQVVGHEKHEGEAATVVCGPTGECLKHFTERTDAGPVIAIAGPKLVIITVGRQVATMAGIPTEPFDMVWIDDVELHPVGDSGLIWEVCGIRDSLGKSVYRGNGGFEVFFPMGQELRDNLTLLSDAIAAAKEKLMCGRCKAGKFGCKHFVLQ